MSDVKRCDQTGVVADTLNPAGWLHITVRAYGSGVPDTLQADTCNADAALQWLKDACTQLGVNIVAPPTLELAPAFEAEVPVDAQPVK